MNTSNPISIHENMQAHPARVVPLKIGDRLCFPKFKCMHLEFPGMEQLKKDLARYRQKEVLIHLFKNANNYSESDEELHSKLFGEKQEGVRIIWEYVNIMIQMRGGVDFLNTQRIMTLF